MAGEPSTLRERRERLVRARAADLYAEFSALGGARGWLAYDLSWRLRRGIDRPLGGPGKGRARRENGARRRRARGQPPRSAGADGGVHPARPRRPALLVLAAADPRPDLRSPGAARRRAGGGESARRGRGLKRPSRRAGP